MNVPIINRQNILIKKLIRKIPRNSYFLEVGCGEGINLEFLSELGFRGKGIDISKEAVELAKKKNINNVVIEKVDFFKFQEKNFDICFFNMVLEHIKNDCDALKKINSFIKKNGFLVISVPAHRKLYSYGDRFIGHYRRYDKEELIRKLSESGFKIKKFWSFGFPISNLYNRAYNIFLYFKYKDVSKKKVLNKKTKQSGIIFYFPKELKFFSKIFFPILSFLIRIDGIFLKTNLGTHYLVLAKKERNIC